MLFRSPQINYPPNTSKNTNCPQNSEPVNELLNRARLLPTVLTTSIPQGEHHHIHCEFCGHCTIRHDGHIDYVHDAELHHVDAIGEVYPHKLAISDINPGGCRPLLNYAWHADGPHNDLKDENILSIENEDPTKISQIIDLYKDQLKKTPLIQLCSAVCFSNQ